MKHIFMIHSHTLLLTSLGVIEKECIPSEDVLLVFSRNYRSAIPLRYKSFDLSKEVEKTFYIMLSWSRRHYRFNKKNRDTSIGSFDEFITKNASEGYFLYCCQLQAFANQILATNPLCEECFFIQEGGRTMKPLLTDQISWFCKCYNRIVLHHDKRLWKMSNWFPDNSTPYNKPITAYAFDRNYFGKMPKEIRMIEWPKIKIEINIDENRPIFVLEGAVELGQIDSGTYEKAVKQLVMKYAASKNYIKFHPKNSEMAKKKYLSFFEEKGVNVEELPMEIPFELILVNFSNLKLYGFGTSLLFYGKSLKHNVVSKEEYLMSSVRYRCYAKGLQRLDEVCS